MITNKIFITTHVATLQIPVLAITMQMAASARHSTPQLLWFFFSGIPVPWTSLTYVCQLLLQDSNQCKHQLRNETNATQRNTAGETEPGSRSDPVNPCWKKPFTVSPNRRVVHYEKGFFVLRTPPQHLQNPLRCSGRPWPLSMHPIRPTSASLV